MKQNQSTHNQRGVSALEFTILAPLLFVLVFGIVEFGLLFYDKAMLTNASREGARAGIIAKSPRVTISEIKQVVLNYAQSHLITFGSDTLEEDNIDVNPDPSGLSFGDDLTVTVNYQYDFLVLPNFGALGWGNLGDPITLTAVTVMRME